jgi:hypothetical protein
MRMKLTTTFVTLLASAAVATLFASPVTAQSKHKLIHPRAAVIQRHDKPSESVAATGRQHSPNPAFDVYSPSGKYMTSDPDPRVREQIIIEY